MIETAMIEIRVDRARDYSYYRVRDDRAGDERHYRVRIVRARTVRTIAI